MRESLRRSRGGSTHLTARRRQTRGRRPSTSKPLSSKVSCSFLCTTKAPDAYHRTSMCRRLGRRKPSVGDTSCEARGATHTVGFIFLGWTGEKYQRRMLPAAALACGPKGAIPGQIECNESASPRHWACNPTSGHQNEARWITLEGGGRRAHHQTARTGA